MINAKKLLGVLRLMRPANIVTAIADILAGIAISGFLPAADGDLSPLFWLVVSTVGLYGGGVVMNDFFDADLDSVERPERPIPSGLISRTAAASFGMLLLIMGIGSAFIVSTFSGSIAVAIALAALIYDKWAKHHFFLGPLLMGICRGLNLLLGLSVVPAQVQHYSWLGVIPVLYIAAITMISQGEVYGGKKPVLAGAMILYVISMAGILWLSFSQDTVAITLVFVGVWAVMVFLPLRRAFMNPEGPLIGKAVRAGVLALILMNAAWASAFGVLSIAIIIVLLLPFSLLLARAFAVT